MSANAAPTSLPSAGDTQTFVSLLDAQAEGLGLYNVESDVTMGERIGQLRRSRRRVSDTNIGVLSLVQDEDGVLRWDLGGGARPQGGARRVRRGGVSGDTLAQYRFEALPPNKIGAYLETADAKLTPVQGLLELERDASASGKGWRWKPAKPVPSEGRLLLFIHGTFSTSENYLDELTSTLHGRAFLETAATRYDVVMAFGHPTLSVSPIANALDLAALFDGTGADIDVIAHSRGGLVTRWWLEALSRNMKGQRRGVLVGSPLGGTSLASPACVRGTMDLLTNVGNVLQKGIKLGSVVAPPLAPFLQLPMILLKVTTAVTGVLAKTPIADAAVAMIPGLNGQSRVGNSPELKRLRRLPDIGVKYAIVRSNFEPTDPGWKFWEYFRVGRLADIGADAVFPGSNDLVVDTDSMAEFRDTPQFKGLHHDFGTSSEVFHTNYFQQKPTLELVAKAFSW